MLVGFLVLSINMWYQAHVITYHGSSVGDIKSLKLLTGII